MQISGVSFQIAKAIVQEYPTIRNLLDIYDNEGLSETVKKNLLADLERPSTDGRSTRKLGQAISQRIYAIFTQTEPSLLEQDLT